VKGVNYNEVYANTAKSGPIRIPLALTATEGLKTALNANIPYKIRQEGLLLSPTQDIIRSLPISNQLIKFASSNVKPITR
jgi:hypothetical protein